MIRINRLGLALLLASFHFACGDDGGDPDGAPQIDAGPQSGDVLWSRRAGSSEEDIAYGAAMIPGGGAAVAGGFGLVADFGTGQILSQGRGDLFVATYDQSGSAVWVTTFGGYSLDTARAHSVAVGTGGEIAIGGWFWGSLQVGEDLLESSGSADGFVTLLDSDGQPIWARSFGGVEADNITGTTIDDAGDVIVTGYFTGTADFGDGEVTAAGDDIIIAKYAAIDGSHLWSTTIGGAGDDFGWMVASDGEGDLFVAGFFVDEVNFGCSTVVGEGNSDAFLVKLDGETGSCLWLREIGGAAADSAYAVAVDGAGDVAVAGVFSGAVDFGGQELNAEGLGSLFVAEYHGSDGSLGWVRRYGGSSFETPWSLAYDDEGDLLVTGSFGGSVSFGGGDLPGDSAGDIFVAEYDGAGAHLWSKRFAGIDQQIGYAIAVDSDQIVVTGSFRQGVGLDGESLVSQGGEDALIFGLRR